MRTFILTEQHIQLLRRSYTWWLEMEFGAAGIDPKRPYGNSDVVGDIAEILGYAKEDLPLKAEAYLRKLHRETQTALQIVLYTGSFIPGTYVAEDRYEEKWELQ